MYGGKEGKGMMDYDDDLDWKRIPVESKVYAYQVRADGMIIRTSKKRFVESRVKPFMKRGKLMVKIANREYCVKHLVAAAFMPRYRKGYGVIHRDGDPVNCGLGNLVVMSARKLGRVTGGDSRRKPVTYGGVEYYSVRDYAKKLYCSCQTLSDYLNGKTRKGVLTGKDIRYSEG